MSRIEYELPEIPESWEWLTIGEVVQRVSNIKPESEPSRAFRYVDISSIDNRQQRVSETRPFYGANAPSRARRPVSPGDVLLSNVRVNLRNTAILEDDIADVCSTGFTVLRANGRVTPNYLFQYVRSDQFVKPLEELQTGTQYPATSDRVVLEQPIPVPPVEIQIKLTILIEEMDHLVNSARERLAKVPLLLKRFRQVVLAAAYSGQLTADWRESGAPCGSVDELIREVQAARLASAAKTPKGALQEPEKTFDIPNSWTWVSLRSLVDLRGGVTKGQKRKAGEQLISAPYLRVANVQRGFLDLTEIKHIDVTPDELEDLRLRRDDLLFNEGGDRDKLGRGWVWEDQIPGCIHQNHVFRGRLYSTRVPAKLVSLYANSVGAQHFIDEGKQTVNLASLSITKLGDMAFPLAPPEEMLEIMRRVGSLFALADSIESRLADATAQVERTTQAILAKAFRGELA